MTTWFDLEGVCGGVSAADRGLQYGDGLFETIAIRGGKPRLWHRHMQRLASACSRLAIPFPGEPALEKLVQVAVDETDAGGSDATVKLIVTAGEGPRGYARPTPVSPTVRAGVFPASRVEPGVYAAGVDVRVCRARLAEQPALAGLKTLNRLEQVLARMELDTAFEGLTCDTSGRVICGTMSNVFVVNGQEICTPSLHRCGVEGVVRSELLERAATHGLPVEIRDIDIGECLQADELILSNSQFGLLPAGRLNDRALEQRAVYERLRDLLAGAGFFEWQA